jgi:hypothetical protein
MLDLSKLTNRELLDAWTKSLDVLYERGIVRTYNNPIGDIAEELVARHYGGTRGAFAQAAWDVAVGDELLQVKACRRATPKTNCATPIRSERSCCWRAMPSVCPLRDVSGQEVFGATCKRWPPVTASMRSTRQ